MTSPVIFTIVSANYLAYAITLMQTVRDHHPGSRRYLILADQARDDLAIDPELFEVILVHDLDIPSFEHFAFRYSVLEFNTAIKPFAFQWLANRHPDDSIIYIDPDIYLLGPLEEVTQRLDAGSLAVLTPHLTAPLNDDKLPDELGIARVGVYNLGFIATGPHPSRPAFLEWWAQRLEHGAFVDIEAGMFTDQVWIALVPGMFPDVDILRHPGYNLAYWNLAHRPVTLRSDGVYLAAGQPIAFIHFSGASVRNPDAFSVHQNRFSARTIGDLEPLYRGYVDLLQANGYERFAKMPYAWSRLRDGTAITPEMRSIFRHRFDHGQPSRRHDPFGMQRGEFEEGVSLASRLSRSFLRAYPRLRDRWPVSSLIARLGPKARSATRAVLQRRATPRSIADALQASRTKGLGLPTARPSGLEDAPQLNVAGYFQGEFGVAEAGRSLVRAARRAGIEVALLNVPAGRAAREDDRRFAGDFVREGRYPISVYCINADQMPQVSALLAPRMHGNYTIGYWNWELGRFPEPWMSSLDLVDEVWVPSEFVRSSVAASTTKRATIVPYAVDVATERSHPRPEFSIDESSFVFLVTFDFASFVERKNPWAAINAFRSAFPTRTRDVTLYIKTINGPKNPAVMAKLKAMAGEDDRIRVVDGFVERESLNGLLGVADAYVSLHRSEGFGLGMAESMALGKPVIATGYSGNVDFMDGESANLVGYELVPIKPSDYPHAEGQTWAEPDVEHAAWYMRRLVENAAYTSALGKRARERIRATLSVEVVGGRIRRELERVMADLPPTD